MHWRQHKTSDPGPPRDHTLVVVLAVAAFVVVLIAIGDGWRL